MESVAIEHLHQQNNKRLRVEWNLSQRCNFDCSYCSPYTHNNFSSWKDISEYKKAVDKLLISTNKEIWISFTGGEPCVYPNFQELVKYCKENGVYFLSVCSNGSRNSDYYTELMRHLDNIIISYHFEYKINVIDSILSIKKYIKNIDGKTMHVHIMMLPGHFEEAIEIMRILKENDILFGVRRIRPLYMPDGSPAKPYQKGGNLKLTSEGPDYSDDRGYYSNDELDFFKRRIHDYI